MEAAHNGGSRPAGDVLESELFRLMLQIIGVIVMTIAIGLLLPLATDVDEKPRVKDDRPDRVFP